MATNGTGKNKKTNTKSKVKQSHSRTIFRSFFMISLAIALACGYFYFVNDDKKDDHIKSVPNYIVEKTGSAAIADFTDKTKQVNQVVDDVITENGATILDVKNLSKMVSRKSVEGSIKWTCSEIPISLEISKINDFEQLLKKRLGKIGADILTIEPDKYNGQSVMRYDIGVKDKLEDNDDVTIIATKIFVIQKSNENIATVEKVKERKTTPGEGKLALIIDDFGYTKEPIQAYRGIHRPLTFAILPNHPYSMDAMKYGKQDGRILILHLPMEAMSSAAKEEAITIHTDMSESEIRAVINQLTEAVPNISGVNNHQGSKATADNRVMQTVMNEMEGKGLFFIDSHTSGSSVAYSTARKLGVPTAQNELFIDNDSDVNAIKMQLRTAGDMALRNGDAIAIGHARMNTAKAIKEIIPELEAKGVEFVFVTELLQ